MHPMRTDQLVVDVTVGRVTGGGAHQHQQLRRAATPADGQQEGPAPTAERTGHDVIHAPQAGRPDRIALLSESLSEARRPGLAAPVAGSVKARR
jgi:hypothetical protein